jgi:hypothetical protein
MFALGRTVMKALFFLGLAAILVSSSTVFASQRGADVRGEYMGQKPPGPVPEIFAPGIVSTDKKELNSVAPFSTKYSNVDMCVSYDGKKLFFGSNRPVSGEGKAEEGHDIWMVTRTETGWSEPENLGPLVNAGEHQIYPTVTKELTLYFQSRREGNIGGSDLYRAEYVNGRYTKPENLGSAVNTEHNEGDVLIAPDESYLIVSSRGRSDSLGRSDLYISFRRPDGSWTKAENMGPTINSEATEYCPMLSPDGRYLFFTSTKSGNGDIYWVDAKIIDALRK